MYRLSPNVSFIISRNTVFICSSVELRARMERKEGCLERFREAVGDLLSNGAQEVEGHTHDSPKRP